MANRWSIIRDNVVAQLKTLPFDDDVVIEKIGRPDGIAGMIGPITIGVCLGGDQWTPPTSEIGNHVNQEAMILVQIVIRADSAIDAVDVLDAAGAIEDVSAIALRVRNLDIGVYGFDDDLNTGAVFLDGVRSDFLQFKGKEPGGAGPLAKVFTLRTTQLPL